MPVYFFAFLMGILTLTKTVVLYGNFDQKNVEYSLKYRVKP